MAAIQKWLCNYYIMWRHCLKGCNFRCTIHPPSLNVIAFIFAEYRGQGNSPPIPPPPPGCRRPKKKPGLIVLNRLTHLPPLLQMLGVQSSMLVEQLTPLNPWTQLHLYPLIWSIQVALFLHGAAWQSSMSTSQLRPVKPAPQSHW